MTQASADQVSFLIHHNIPWSKVFDAENMHRFQYMKVMSANKLVVAIGVSECKAAGHTMRNRAGLCVQCNPASLAFLLRYDEPGDIYIAHSASTGFTKIGSSKNAGSRIKSLNSEGYGKASDWELNFHQRCEKVGYIESLIQAQMINHRGTSSYVKQGLTVHCQELFTCSVKVAISAAKKVLASQIT
jgi:hypothetical protein